MAGLPHVMVRLSEDRLSEEILSVQTTSPPRHAVLDFTKITYLGSIHLGQLLKLRQHQNAHDLHLRLFGLRPEVRKLFRLTSLDVLLDICDSETEAIAPL